MTGNWLRARESWFSLCWCRHVLVAGCWVILSANWSAAQTASPETAPSADWYRAEVQPLLEKHCLKCHGGGPNPKGGLRLTSRAALERGGESGPAVSREKPAESILLQAINYENYEMPPSGKLSPEQIRTLTRWVTAGLPGLPASTPADETAGPAAKSASPQVNENTKKFWSFQPVRSPPVPPVQNPEWQRNPVDAFVYEKLVAHGLQPNGPADKRAWLRRATYDLTGLPPEPAEVEAFLADDSPTAYERVLDRLLDSHHYGEHWARFWLDLVRYAETNSYERDGAKPFVWRYRDYVVRAFNQDVPYSQFIREQLAGDEQHPATPEALIATGYYRLGIWDDEPADPEQALYDDLDDLVQTTGQVFLGLTIGCARCHDHKLDPIPQRDYYRFLAFFRNVRRYGVRNHDSVLAASVRTIATAEEQQRHAELVAEHTRRLAEVEQNLKQIEERVRDDFVGVEKDEFKSENARVEIVGKRVPKLLTAAEFQQYRDWTRQRQELRANKPAGMAQALCVSERGSEAPDTLVLVRGNPHVPGERVEPGFPAVLGGPAPRITTPAGGIPSSGRRTALAEWLVHRDNPLTARVLVNRVWQRHFGRGLVRSASDFGLQGTPPTHQELLDWLAADFMDHGWKLKRLHRQLMLSQAYRMSSAPQAAGLAQDPENQWFWQYNMRRLTAEEIRDSILAVNGSLGREPYAGPSVFVPIPQEVLAGQSRPGEGWGSSSPADQTLRSVFIHIKRSLTPPILAAFDAADTDNSCPVRFTSTQPTQALAMLNSPFLQEQAGVLARYLQRSAPGGLEDQIKLAWWRVCQRSPNSQDVKQGMQLVNTLRTKHGCSENEALRQLCLLLYNLNEFVYLD